MPPFIGPTCSPFSSVPAYLMKYSMASLVTSGIGYDVGVAPAVLTDDRTRIGAVFECGYFVAVVALVLGEHLAADEAHARMASAASGHAADPLAVVVLRADRSGDVRAVLRRGDLVDESVKRTPMNR